jgi:hypothetical protein
MPMGTARRAPVQGEYKGVGKSIPAGTISWEEHVAAWEVYDKKWHNGQSAERIAQRGGFAYSELVELLGRSPETWERR